MIKHLHDRFSSHRHFGGRRFGDSYREEYDDRFSSEYDNEYGKGNDMKDDQTE
ncbi:hypothetical protein Ana3638_22330 [Anaerocolumna sedimenticola]|uniref:Uncharacterized protein n=1 Tax=Anaerocolumna sedimenticola TaxID=2696063 RepID=A0A6P1TSD0_9FIRM|nr:hypothetical protein [Anaerocolumna sedimenticola]QHQ63172.1 hypothetical protein Ana3638_22330 [Anaerocolumna sedimenticola]